MIVLPEMRQAIVNALSKAVPGMAFVVTMVPFGEGKREATFIANCTPDEGIGLLRQIVAQHDAGQGYESKNTADAAGD